MLVLYTPPHTHTPFIFFYKLYIHISTGAHKRTEAHTEKERDGILYTRRHDTIRLHAIRDGTNEPKLFAFTN